MTEKIKEILVYIYIYIYGCAGHKLSLSEELEIKNHLTESLRANHAVQYHEGRYRLNNGVIT